MQLFAAQFGVWLSWTTWLVMSNSLAIIHLNNIKSTNRPSLVMDLKYLKT